MARARGRRCPRRRAGPGGVTLQVAIIGIDGSGKSTLAASLAVVIAAEHGLIADSAAADEFWFRAPHGDNAAPGFHPPRYTLAARPDPVVPKLSHPGLDPHAPYPPAP